MAISDTVLSTYQYTEDRGSVAHVQIRIRNYLLLARTHKKNVTLCSAEERGILICFLIGYQIAQMTSIHSIQSPTIQEALDEEARREKENEKVKALLFDSESDPDNASCISKWLHLLKRKYDGVPPSDYSNIESDSSTVNPQVEKTFPVKHSLIMDGTIFDFYDVSNLDPQTWPDLFEFVDVVVFVAALSDYNQTTMKGAQNAASTNKLNKACEAFHAVCCSPQYRIDSKAVILCLNRNECFACKF